MKCDLLVVGASSAGLSATVAAARAGFDVILIDEGFGGSRRVANTVFEGMASRAGLKVDDSCIIKRLKGMRILSPSARGVTVPAKGYFIDRQKLDDFCLLEAETLGVSLVEGRAEGMTLHDGERTVSTDSGDIRAKVVVDASGIRPALAAKAGLSTMRHPSDIAWAMEADVRLPNLGDEDYFEYWIGSMAPGWKATFSPAGGDRASLGVFVRGHGQDVQPFFRSFLKRFKSYKSPTCGDMEGMKILSIRRGGDPIAVLPGDIVSDAFMVTGGAAGQSGLAYSMRAGEICGSVAAEALAAGDTSRHLLSRYRDLWRREFGWEYRMGRAALETLKGMKDEDIDRLAASLSGKKLIHEGSFLGKSFKAGATVALARPATTLDLARCLLRG